MPVLRLTPESLRALVRLVKACRTSLPAELRRLAMPTPIPMLWSILPPEVQRSMVALWSDLLRLRHDRAWRPSRDPDACQCPAGDHPSDHREAKGSNVYTDEYSIYARLPGLGYRHKTVCLAHDEVRDFFRPATRRKEHVPAARQRAIHVQRVAALRDMLAVA